MTEFEERELDELIQVRLFLRDNRHLRFEETPENLDVLGRFLDEHSLPVTAANLRPGESSWMAARRAFAEQQIAEQRKARQEMRAKMQSLPRGEVDPARSTTCMLPPENRVDEVRRLSLIGPIGKWNKGGVGMYNAYLATRQKARKQREDSATAGMAETPSGGAKSSEELKAMGDVGSIRMRPR